MFCITCSTATPSTDANVVYSSRSAFIIQRRYRRRLTDWPCFLSIFWRPVRQQPQQNHCDVYASSAPSAHHKCVDKQIRQRKNCSSSTLAVSFEVSLNISRNPTDESSSTIPTDSFALLLIFNGVAWLYYRSEQSGSALDILCCSCVLFHEQHPACALLFWIFIDDTAFY